MNITFLLVLLFHQSSFAQKTAEEVSEEVYYQRVHEHQFKDSYFHLNLGMVIEQGLRENYDQISRRYEQEQIELGWEDTFESFWYPQLRFKFDVNPHQIGRITSFQGGSSTTKEVSGNLSFGVEDYTLFNWGKDYLLYLNDKNSYLRAKKTLSEEKRHLRHDLIIAYFRLNSFKKIEKVRKKQVRQASFIYRLSKERISLNKINKQEFLMAKAEYLKAQNLYHQAKQDAEREDEIMAQMISEPAGRRYILQDDLDYQHMKVSFEEATKIAANRSPDVLEAEKDIENAKREYAVMLKENLPLPKITARFGAINHTFGPSSTNVKTSYSNQNFELLASVQATWAITGAGGVFNRRSMKSSLLGREKAHILKLKAIHNAKSEVRKHYKQALGHQDQVAILEVRIPALQKAYDTIVANYLDRKTAFVNFSRSLEELGEAESLLEYHKYKHVEEQILLAKAMGVDDFPGGNFELLALKNQEK